MAAHPIKLQPQLLALALALAAGLSALLLLPLGSAPTSPVDAGRAAAAAALDRLPLQFVENRGQVDARAELYVAGKDASYFFTGDGVRMSLAERGGDRRYALGLDFVGARPGARPIGRDRTAASVSYFRGPRSAWKAGVPTYAEVAYRDLWPGIDLIYSGTGARLKYSFLVKPGADPAAIQLAWQGATGTSVTRGGELRVATPAGVVRDKAPVSHQTVGGRRVRVDSSYSLGKGNRYGFSVGAYDRAKPLVIDPAILVYAGFIGGAADEQANNVALDSQRNLYVVGSTAAPNFPTTPGAFERDFGGGLDDAFVAKVNPSGTGLVYAAYIGGSDRDTAINIDVDATGAAYVGGSTSSTQTSFPATVGPDTTYNGGPQDAWIAKVNPAGSALVYAGYVGGAGIGMPNAPVEQANGLDVDAAGNAYLAGFTSSDQATFPDGNGFNPQTGGYDQTFNSVAPGVIDAFVVKVNAAGSGLAWGTYVGGGGADAGTGLVVDGAGNAHLNVFTGSNEGPQSVVPPTPNPFGGFPITQGAFDPTYNGPDGPAPGDVAAVKLNTTASGAGSLVYSTYVGGAGIEQPFGNVIDAAGNTYITGYTTSSHATFPDGNGFGAIPGFDRTYNGGTGQDLQTDTFVVKLNPTGTALGYATYVGGAGNEQTVAIDIDGSGGAHVFGTTSSAQSTFPVQNGPDSTYNGGPSDAFVARLTPAGTTIDFAGYVGGAGEDTGIGLTLDTAGDVYVAGGTDSSQSDGFPVRVGPDTTFNGPFGDTDAFVAKLQHVRTGRPLPVPGYPIPTACPNRSAIVIPGTAGNDTLTGTPQRDHILARDGNDRADGRAGGDCLDLGRGNDTGQGGSGADLVLGGQGNDRMSGSSGGDSLRGGSGADRLGGGSGNDRLSGQSGRDRVTGSGGRDRISGGSSADRISAGSGNDRAAGDRGNDRIGGNSGSDRLSGGSGRDRISGGSGADRISGGSGNDRIAARDGRRDRVNCGSGRDVVSADRVDVVARNCERTSRAGSAQLAGAALGAVPAALVGGLLGLLRRRRRGRAGALPTGQRSG